MKNVIYFLLFATFLLKTRCELFIDNFEENDDVSEWKEHSDSIFMPEGMSKASFVLQKTVFFKRAVLFTLLHPQSCGAAIAGCRKNVSMDITGYNSVVMKIRNRGEYSGYEFFFRHKGQTGRKFPSYVHYFKAPFEMETLIMPIENFLPYSMGKPVKDAEPLDTSNITSLGILAYGGAHAPKKQVGVASLEIDWIKVV